MDKEKQLIFGIHPILEKLKASPAEITEIIIADGPSRAASRAVETAARHLGVRVNYASSAALDRLATGQRHQGVVAKIAAFSYLEIPQLLQNLSSSSRLEQVLILDGLTDPRNFGALLRTAEAVGIQHVVIPKDRAVGVTPTVVKASAGAVHHLKIYKSTNLRRAIKSLKDQGFWLAGLDIQAPDGIYDRALPEKLGIVLGSEGEGIRPLIRRECDFLVSIPMAGKIASLNVAAAGAVFLYEVFRQNHSVDKDRTKRY
jgi:23S rRNA (guanosine2251-2'-O)-methyltransferase